MNKNKETNTGYDSDDMSLDMEIKGKHTRKKAKATSTESEADIADKQVSAFINFFKSKLTHAAFGVLLIFIATYLLVAMISFLYTGENDQSMINYAEYSTMVDEKNIENAGGIVGATLSNSTIINGLGIGSFVIIYYLSVIGLSLIVSRRIHFWNLTFKSILIAIAISVVSGLISFNHEGLFHLGGIHGYYVNDFLITNTGIWGAIGVSILLAIFVGLIFATQINAIINKYINAIKARKERLRLEAEEKANQEISQNTSKDTEPTPIIVDFEVGHDSDTNDVKQEEQDIKTEHDIKEEVVTLDEETIDNENNPTGEILHPTIEVAEEINVNCYDPTAELSKYRFPSIELLKEPNKSNTSEDNAKQEENKELIKNVLADFNIDIDDIKVTVGPTVTLFEIIPSANVRIAKIKNLEDDIALKLAALGIRIIAPIPGKGTVGIEVPNKDPQIVPMRSIITSKAYQESKADLPIAVGVTISNEVYITDLAKLPHLLVAGATGMGKSVGLNAIIASLLYKKHPAELKFVLVDPKMVEFSLYSKLERHYLAKLPDEDKAVITDSSKVVSTLNSLCVEMENRYELLTKAQVRTINEYNNLFTNHRLNPEKGHRYLPYIVVIVDEFADLIMTAGREIEIPISRITQKARAVGIHMILATQRPDTKVVTGLIKANIPGRIAFRVNQMVDSRTILDRPGANQLIGKGDMLFSRDGIIERVQCAFISTEEVVAICDSIDEQIGYEHAYLLPDYIPEAGDGGIGNSSNLNDRDPLFDDAARAIIKSQTASTSSLQRAYKIGYNRAGRIMDQMEAAGIVGPSQGGRPRQVLVDPIQLEQILGYK